MEGIEVKKNLSELLQELQECIKNTDISTVDTPVGIIFSTSGYIRVQFSLSKSNRAYETVDQAADFLQDFLNKNTENKVLPRGQGSIYTPFDELGYYPTC